MTIGLETGLEPAALETAARRAGLCERFARTRSRTLSLIEPLTPEDMVVQSMPNASPVKWHLAHTTWFFERFVLRAFSPGYAPAHEVYEYLFNSYYNTVGPQHCRPRRGLLSRPTVEEVLAYRAMVDERVGSLLESSDDPEPARIVEIGLQHEEQHQELMITDMKHMLSCNPLLPALLPALLRPIRTPASAPWDEGSGAQLGPMRWRRLDGGVAPIGGAPQEGFRFDNELPRHRVFLEPFEMAHRPVSNAEFRAFIEDGGYRRPELWLSLGWERVREEGWAHPLYWFLRDGAYHQYTLAGAVPLRDDEPVCHLSYFEADAYARWAGARLPTEFEWEHAAGESPMDGVIADEGRFHPSPLDPREDKPARFFGDVWEWTSSAYAPYPGFKPPEGALGEYNGKFMCNQYVLRGGSCATARSQARLSYRNFFPPEARWQFAGVRLARDAETRDAGEREAGAREAGADGDGSAATIRGTEPRPPMIAEVLEGLRSSPKRLPTKLLYDERGSALFERITRLPEYYLTRAELSILDASAQEMASEIGAGAWVIELGSGDGRKTRRLLSALERPAGYAAIEISRRSLNASTRALREAMPGLAVASVHGDFTGDVVLPPTASAKRVIFFPGSTIGNFDGADARALIQRIARWAGSGGGLLFGVDLVKPAEILMRAYDDAAGVTAEFNLNLLERLNHEAGADFKLEAWSHRAVWNQRLSRMESYLVSRRSQRARVDGEGFEFGRGEAVLTECSKKYTLEAVRELAEPFELRSWWLDERGWFAVVYLELGDG